MFSIRTIALALGLGGCVLVGGCDRSRSSSGVADRPVETQSGDKTNDKGSLTQLSSTHRVNGTPVSAVLTLEPGRVKLGDEVTLTVQLKIEPLWELRALGDHSETMATQLELHLPGDVATDGDWQAPPSTRSISPDGHPVYVDQATFRQKLRVKPDASPGGRPIECRVNYQACNDQQCLEPAAVKLVAKLTVE
jgi:hypothetical protein